MTQITLITRMTTEYQPEEDRLRLLAQLHDGRTEVLWLTQRLILRLVPALLEWLGEPDVDSAGRLPPDSTETAGSRAEKPGTAGGSAAQKSTQQSTQPPADKPTTPVTVAADSAAWLVQKVDLQRQPELIQLQFYSTGATPLAAGIAFTREPLLQWLGIVMNLCINAGWPDNLWPQWLTAYIPGRIQGAPLH